MNDRRHHLLCKSVDAKQGGHAAWSDQSIGERVAVALVLNRADWLAEINYSIAEAIERTGADLVSIVPEIARRLEEDEPLMMRPDRAKRLEVFGTILAALLAIALVATSTGRDVLAWVYLQSTQAIEHSVHLPFPLERLDPTCPECM